jgi:hypothetical protein
VARVNYERACIQSSRLSRAYGYDAVIEKILATFKSPK